MKKLILAGNWKMNKTIAESVDFANIFCNRVKASKHKIIICPVFTCVHALAQAFKGTNIDVGAQNVHFADSGAYTGEISANMLKDVGAKYVIIGHSERRQYNAETNEIVNLKLKKAIESGLTAIMCIGESLIQREKNRTFSVLKKQLTEGLTGITELDNIIIAYEPIWAIGTGKTASSEQIAKTHAGIKRVLKSIFGQQQSKNIKILYGGSVNNSNAKEILALKNVNGALVGGASLSAEKFSDLILSV